MRDPLPDPRHRACRAHGAHPLSAVVIGVGNLYRRDDAAGLEVVRLLRGRLPDGVDLLEREGEPTSLFAAWEDADAVWVADAVRSTTPAGTVHRLDVGTHPLPDDLFRTSTHALGLADAVEIARALGRLPAHTIIFGISGHDFSAGQGLTPPVAETTAAVADAIRTEVAQYTQRSPAT